MANENVTPGFTNISIIGDCQIAPGDTLTVAVGATFNMLGTMVAWLGSTISLQGTMALSTIGSLIDVSDGSIEIHTPNGLQIQPSGGGASAQVLNNGILAVNSGGLVTVASGGQATIQGGGTLTVDHLGAVEMDGASTFDVNTGAAIHLEANGSLLVRSSGIVELASGSELIIDPGTLVYRGVGDEVSIQLRDLLTQGMNAVVVNCTLAEINAGKDLLAAIAGVAYKVHRVEMEVIGNFATTTSIKVEDASSTVDIVDVAVAGLVDGARITPGHANVTPAAGDMGRAATTTGEAVVVVNNGAAATGGTSIDIMLFYTVVHP